MRLLFNATNLRSEGGVILMQNLLESFLAHAPDLQIRLYLNPELHERVKGILTESQTDNPGNPTRIEIIPFRPRGALKRFAWEQISLPRLIRKHQIDILFSFGNTGPLFPGCRQILYLQQAIPYSSYIPPGQPLLQLRWLGFKALYGFLIGLTQLGSQKIVVPTGWLVRPLQRSIAGLKPAHAYSITLPGNPGIREKRDAKRFTDSELTLLSQLEKWRASEEKILFYPCYLAPYKNIPFLLKALHLLAQQEPPPFRLILTFNDDSREYFPCRAQVLEALSDCAARERVVLSGSLGRDMIAELYRLSDILVFPSLVETLGLPLLEAMSHGIAVVATQNEQPDATQAAFAREICGSAALYAPPQDVAQFAAHLRTLLTNPQLAFDLGQEGLSRVQDLSWHAHVQAILAL